MPEFNHTLFYDLKKVPLWSIKYNSKSAMMYHNHTRILLLIHTILAFWWIPSGPAIRQHKKDFTFFISNVELSGTVPQSVNMGICELKPEFYNHDFYRKESVKPFTDHSQLPCMNDRMTSFSTQVFLSGCWFVDDERAPWSSDGWWGKSGFNKKYHVWMEYANVGNQ